jgi:hypothetical protein
MVISKKVKDSCFLLRNGDYAYVTRTLVGYGGDEDRYVCNIVANAHVQSLYNEPCDSKLFHIGVLRNPFAQQNICGERVLRKRDFYKKVVVLQS